VLLPATYVCPHCAQAIETAVDSSQGVRQSYVEDCQVCCRPLILHVEIVGDDTRIEASPENE
jgi:hypothetical protein